MSHGFRLDEAIPIVAVPQGKGGRLAAIPLVEEGLQAAHDFCVTGGFWVVSCSSANKAPARAARPDHQVFSQTASLMTTTAGGPRRSTPRGPAHSGF